MSSINELLQTILDRVSTADKDQTACFHWDEVTLLPDENFKLLESLGVLKGAQPNLIIECDGCEERCNMQVEIFQKTENKPARAYIQCDKNDDFGRINVDFDRLKQWQLSAQQLAQLVAKCCGIAHDVVKDANNWRIGMLEGKKHR